MTLSRFIPTNLGWFYGQPQDPRSNSTVPRLLRHAVHMFEGPSAKLQNTRAYRDLYTLSQDLEPTSEIILHFPLTSSPESRNPFTRITDLHLNEYYLSSCLPQFPRPFAVATPTSAMPSRISGACNGCRSKKQKVRPFSVIADLRGKCIPLGMLLPRSSVLLKSHIVNIFL